MLVNLSAILGVSNIMVVQMKTWRVVLLHQLFCRNGILNIYFLKNILSKNRKQRFYCVNIWLKINMTVKEFYFKERQTWTIISIRLRVHYNLEI